MRERRRRVHGGRLAAVGLTMALLTLTGCGGGTEDDVEPPEAAPSTGPGPDLSDAVLWLDFESDAVAYDGSTEYRDANGGPFAGRVVTGNDGAVEQVDGAHRSDTAVAFPAKCTAATGCPRAMLEVQPAAALNPGEEVFEFGAAVWLASDQTTTGSNIVQKGRFASEGGLWKLQVDNDAGRPSCVVGSGADQLVVRSEVSISDSAWHFVVCRRDSDGISIRVDGTVDRKGGRTASVSNEWPIRIGSPGVNDQDDQFHGRIDDVFLRVDPAG